MNNKQMTRLLDESPIGPINTQNAWDKYKLKSMQINSPRGV